MFCQLNYRTILDGTPDGARTRNLQIESLMILPVDLQEHLVGTAGIEPALSALQAGDVDHVVHVPSYCCRDSSPPAGAALPGPGPDGFKGRCGTRARPHAMKMGGATGYDPATSGATIQRSSPIELRPTYVDTRTFLPGDYLRRRAQDPGRCLRIRTENRCLMKALLGPSSWAAWLRRVDLNH